MKNFRTFKTAFALLLAAAGLVCTPGLSAAAKKPAVSTNKKSATPAVKPLPVVRVNVTDEPYDFIHPWDKKQAFTHRALGIVLPGNRVLVTAELVADSTYAQLERPDTGDKVPALVDAIDYEANLAILEPTKDDFLKGVKPLVLDDAKTGDAVSVWQVENTGALLTTSALLTTVEVTHYPIGNATLLLYRLTSQLQYRDNSFTVPVVKGGKLIGLLMRYDARSQNADVIPATVIKHFLTAAAKKEYKGFPEAGLFYAASRDPDLRAYAGLKPTDTGGVYVSEVLKHSPADDAGIQAGDVLLAIGNNAIDQDGNYTDPQYGKLSLLNLICTKSYDGDVLKFKIAHQGEEKTVDVKVANRPPDDYVIDPYIIGKAPKYYVLGGLVFQELSRQYLKEWGAGGGDWSKKAPLRFVYMDQYQSELFPEAGSHHKLVFLSQVLPCKGTLGYDDLWGLIITKINDVPINSLADIDTALQKPQNGFHKIEFDEYPKVIYLDAKQVEADSRLLMKKYEIDSLKQLE
ncbi:MAG TPA: PDZ domain-containing protein [Chthoniobacteraceae bacterium]|nr:PDZ domain-containing protein [Chthoniobacteraceae bacterium]